VKQTLTLLVTTGLLSLPCALATDVVETSNLTGFDLPAGAVELTEDDFPSEMVDLLDTTAEGLKGKCEYHELLYWDGDPKKVTAQMNADIPDPFTLSDLDVGKMDDGSDYQQFVLKSPKQWFAGVWFQDLKAKNVILAWCQVVKK